MKTPRYMALACCALSLFATTSVMANDTEKGNPDVVAKTGWIPSASQSFIVRTMQDTNGDLIVRVNNTVKQAIMLRLLDLKGNEMAFDVLGGRPRPHLVRFELSDVPDGEYRLEVQTKKEKVVKKVTLATPDVPSRQTAISVLN